MVRLVNSVFGPHTVFWHALGLLVLVGLLLGAVIGGSVWATVIFSVGVSLQTTILVFLVGWKRQMRRRLAGR
jgi:protein-S-isoprenylcysteine O-methyltransferase Ste14